MIPRRPTTPARRCRRRSSNTEIANQAKLDVVINSNDPNYTDDTDYTDGGGSPTLGNPCSLHTTGDDISAPGQWTDVRVKERDLPSLAGGFGLPLSRNRARARVEVRPAVSGTRFLPLAVPNNIITKVQVRYYNDCTGGPDRAAARPRAAARRRPGRLCLGGRRDAVGPPERRRPHGRGQDPLVRPVDAELRPGMRRLRAGRRRGPAREPGRHRPRNQSCSTLLALTFADCFHRLSQIRVCKDGNADNQPRIPRVTLTGGCGGAADAYFSPLPTASTNCSTTPPSRSTGARATIRRTTSTATSP